MKQKKTNRKGKEHQKPGPIKKKDIQQNPDPRIDQDFPGHPHAPAHNEIINPETDLEKKIADIYNKDSEKRNYKKKQTEEQLKDDGSANAFEATEDIPKTASNDEPEENY